MITLHHVAQSRSERVLWLLNELEVEFRLVLHPFDKSLRQPDYLTLSPAGRVPALEIEGERMFESGAIVEYLCEVFPEAGLGRLPGDMDRMAWLVWVHFAETVSQHVAILTQQHIMLREDHMRSPAVMKLEVLRLEKCYAAIEGRLSTPVENRDYLLTAGFSACDICVGQAVHMARRFAPIDAFPELSRWMARITGRAGFRAAQPGPEDSLIYTQPFYEPPHG